MHVKCGWTWATGLCVAGATAVLTCAIAVRSDAAQPRDQTPAPRTTLTGIYAPSQADKGEDTYLSICVGCHPTVTYTGPGFKQNWAGRPLSDLYDWVSEKMPKNDPGSLTPQESVQVIAYILRLNKMPPGKTDLTADRNALRRIRIELK